MGNCTEIKSKKTKATFSVNSEDWEKLKLIAEALNRPPFRVTRTSILAKVLKDIISEYELR